MKNLEQRCSDAGLKMTGQRRIILKTLEASGDHPSVDSVFEEMDIIIKREFKESFARYDINTEHHHHMIDLETGEVIEFKNEELELLKLKIAKELGYELLDHRLDLYGRKIKSSG
jgi:Fur family transcriptional regulator, ferric uptake regulator